MPRLLLLMHLQNPKSQLKQMLVLTPPIISPQWEEVRWIGTYYVHFDEDGSGNCTWELVKGAGFKEIVTPVAMAA